MQLINDGNTILTTLGQRFSSKEEGYIKMKFEIDKTFEYPWIKNNLFETKLVDRKEIEVELCELKQNSAPVTKLSEKLTPDPATIFSQLRARHKKLKIDLADLEAILEF